MAGVGLLGQMLADAELTVMLSGAVALSQAADATWTVKLEVPVVVGVPEITPVAGARVSPAGNVPLAIDQEYGGVPPVAVRVAV
jgi:hypothetical protein